MTSIHRLFTRVAFAVFIMNANAQLPGGLELIEFAGPPNISYPAGVAAAPDGRVFISIDANSSLSRDPNRGKVVCAKDTNGDGKADLFTDFIPNIDSPRSGCFVGNTLYLIHPPFLTAFQDTTGDGVADKRTELAKGLGFDLTFRGADHTTNGVRMGIDGWLYIAVGDYGMLRGEGRDGSTLYMHGGGVARIRPDGTELELVSFGTRNIYDVAVSPLLDLFARDNTNDGLGWNTRFHHLIPLSDAGYPRLYKFFEEETLPPLVDFGGGAGTGMLYIQEPGLPPPFNDGLYSCDFTTSKVYFHPLARHEATFTVEQQDFWRTSKAIDIDVDGSSRIYMSNWKDGGYNYSHDKVGQVFMARHPSYKTQPFPELRTMDEAGLLLALASDSHVLRLNAQRALVASPPSAKAVNGCVALAHKTNAPLPVRVAALFTLAQLAGEHALPYLQKMTTDPAIREFALRAMVDRTDLRAKAPRKPFIDALSDPDPRVRLQAITGLARIGAHEAADAMLELGRTDPTAKKEITTPSKAAKGTRETTHRKPPVSIELDIRGAKDLYLAVMNGGDGNGADHGNWIEPHLIGPTGTKRLTDLDWKSATTGWGQTLKNASCTGKKLEVEKFRAIEYGIGTHADSIIHFELPEGYHTFKTLAGTDAVGSKQSDGKIVFIADTRPPEAPKSPEKKQPHNAIPHIVAQALARISAAEACIRGLDDPGLRTTAIHALYRMHSAQTVSLLEQRLATNPSTDVRNAVLRVLARLYHREGTWDAKKWWGTKPDHRGPYFIVETWEQSPAIRALLEKYMSSLSPNDAKDLIEWMRAFRIDPSSWNLNVVEDPLLALLDRETLSPTDLRALGTAAIDPSRDAAVAARAYDALPRTGANPDILLAARMEVLAAWHVANGQDPRIAARLDDLVFDPISMAATGTVSRIAMQEKGFKAETAWQIALHSTHSPIADTTTQNLYRSLARNGQNKPDMYHAMARRGWTQYLPIVKNASEKGTAEVQIAAQMALARLEQSGPTSVASERVGVSPPDDALQRISALTGNAARGAGIFAQQACLACHAVSMEQVQKGPYLGDAGEKFTREYLLESILFPEKVVSQGFQSTWFTLKDGSTHEGFVTSTKGELIELRNMVGLVTTIDTRQVKEQGQRAQSMMPPALAATLTWQELADLIAYMENLK